jgi:transcriptional regulator with XRE-family HTH domain
MEFKLELFRRQQVERLEMVRHSRRMNQGEFAAFLGIEPGSYSDIKRGKNGISKNILYKLENKLNVNIQWILTGEGEMLRDDASVIASAGKEVLIPYTKMPTEGVNDYIDKLFKIIESKDKQIDHQLETIRKQGDMLQRLLEKY